MSPSQSIPRHYGLTDVGLHRSNNEDALFADPAAGLFIVSDGMGGRNAGEVAAGAVVSDLPALLAEKFARGAPAEDPQFARLLHETVSELSQRIYKLAEGKAGLTGLGATVAMVLLRDTTAWVANMGDSPCYLLRNRELYRLTEEHNIAAIMLATGDINPGEYASHPARSVLSRHMGMKQTVYPDVRRVGLAPGDRLLLCSDGLNSMVPEATIETMLGQMDTCERTAHALVDAAKAAGGKDNITVLVVDV